MQTRPIVRLFTLGCLLATFAVCSTVRAQSNRLSARELMNRPGVLIIAHRGDSKVAPENTLPAFDSAIKAGSDMIELDYHESADGIPVVIHDGTLDRTTNAIVLWGGSKIRVADKPLAELKKLDAGSWFSPQFAGTKLSTLSETLDYIQPRNMAMFERKSGNPATCVRLIQEKQAVDRVVLESFDWEFVRACHRLAPELMLAALGDKELTNERLDEIATTGASIVAWNERQLDAAGIAAIHERGWKACVWTVDDPVRIRQLVAAKVDSIITNRPAATREVVEAALAGR